MQPPDETPPGTPSPEKSAGEHEEAKALAESAQHFCNVARRGKHPESSSGERAAHLIAKALDKQRFGIARIDSSLVEGLIALIRVAALTPHSDYTASLFDHATGRKVKRS